MVKVNEKTQMIIDSAQTWMPYNVIPPESVQTSLDIESNDNFRSVIDELVQKMTDEEVVEIASDSVKASFFLIKEHIAWTVRMMMNTLHEKDNADDIAEDLLLDATDFIGNDPEVFNADNKSLDTMRNNTAFREHVKQVIRESDPEEYEDAMKSQKQAAIFVWKLYVLWAYVPNF